MAGAALMALLGGGSSAVIADSLAHDDMDRLAQDYRNWAGKFQAMPEGVQSNYKEIFGSGPMTNMDRTIAAMILTGKAEPADPGQAAADTKAGLKAIQLASMLRRQTPAMGEVVGALASEENQLFFKESAKGYSSQDVAQAAQEGAGVNAGVPAFAAVAGGLGGAALGHKGFAADPVKRMPMSGLFR